MQPSLIVSKPRCIEASSPRYLKPRSRVLSLSVAASFVVVFLAALCVGPVSLPVESVILSLVGQPPDRLAEITVWSLRLPRSLMAVLVGAGLGLAGAAMQGVLRNPLAEPGLAGVSSGAAVGAALILTLFPGLQPQTLWLPLAAFLGAGLATFLVVTLAGTGERLEGAAHTAARILLAGIAMNAFVAALLGLASYWADDGGLRNLTFWTLGSVARANWGNLLLVTLAVGLPALWLSRKAPVFNALMLGEAEAGYLGVNVPLFQRKVFVCVALMVGVATAFCGMIGFIGLIAPHLVRLVLGPSYQRLLLLSPIVGAALLLVADIVARTIVTPAELPVGIVTALIGTPFFVWMQLRSRRAGVT
jgi:iron complex transport system permease protein